MDIVLKITAILLIVSGVIWFIIFQLNKKKMFEEYANKKLSNFNDDDIIPVEVSVEFLSSGLKAIMKTILLHTFIPYGLVMIGLLIIILSTRL